METEVETETGADAALTELLETVWNCERIERLTDRILAGARSLR